MCSYKLLRVSGVHKPRCQVAAATKFFTVAPNVCGASLIHHPGVQNFDVAFRFLEKICTPVQLWQLSEYCWFCGVWSYDNGVSNDLSLLGCYAMATGK
jgi:hypothetical protein